MVITHAGSANMDIVITYKEDLSLSSLHNSGLASDCDYCLSLPNSVCSLLKSDQLSYPPI